MSNNIKTSKITNGEKRGRLNEISKGFSLNGVELNVYGCLSLVAYLVEDMVRVPKKCIEGLKLYCSALKEKEILLEYATNENQHSKLINLFCDIVPENHIYASEELIKKAIKKSYDDTWEFIPISIEKKQYYAAKRKIKRLIKKTTDNVKKLKLEKKLSKMIMDWNV